MSQALDPVTQHHVRQGRRGARGRVRRRLLEETIERYIAESLDLLGGSKINVYVPVLAHRFARERLKALAQAEGMIVKEQPEVLFVCVHNAGRSQMAAGLVKLRSGGPHPRPLGRQRSRARQINPAVVEVMAEIGVDMGEDIPEAAHRRGRPRCRRRDHDGLRRRLPDLSGQALRGLGARRSGRSGRGGRCARIRDEIDARVRRLVGELLSA